MDSPIDDAIAGAKAQAARLPVIVPIRRLAVMSFRQGQVPTFSE